MRETYGTLLQTSQDYCVDDKTSSMTNLSSTKTFLKKEINKTVRFIHSRVRNYKTQALPSTMSTVADQIYYSYPPNIDSIESATMTVGSIAYPLVTVDSQQEWNNLQQITIAASTIPKYIFPRKYDFGIFPTPSAAYTVTLVPNTMPSDMSADDYTTGTVATTQNSQTVTGSSTTFTAAMVGRYFSGADSDGIANGSWYRISAFGSTTSLTLQSVFEETALSGAKYIIGESPEIPVELHELIPYRVAGTYQLTRRSNPTKAQPFFNMFFTGDPANGNRSGRIEGGLIGAIQRYKAKGRDNSGITYMNKQQFNYFDERWSITLTS